MKEQVLQFNENAKKISVIGYEKTDTEWVVKVRFHDDVYYYTYEMTISLDDSDVTSMQKEKSKKIEISSGQLLKTVTDKEFLLAKDPPPTCKISITDIIYSYEDYRITQIEVKGVAWGVPEVWVQLHPLELNIQKSPVHDNLWNVAFDFSDNPLIGEFILTVNTRYRTPQNIPGGCSTSTSLEIHVPNISKRIPSATIPSSDTGYEVDLREACHSGFDQRKMGFIAGYVDRFVPMISFIPLNQSFGKYLKSDEIKLMRMVRKTGLTSGQSMKWVKDYEELCSQAISNISDKVLKKNQTLSYDHILAAISKVEMKMMADKYTTKKLKKLRIKDFSHGLKIITSPPTKYTVGDGIKVHDVPPKGELKKFAIPGLAMVAVDEKEPVGVVAGVSQFISMGWLGILFYDRLRIRPTGTTVGERIHTISLGPGEEITYTKKSVTKRSKSFEEIITKEQEQNLEFSSTWSTDLASGTSDTSTSSDTTTLGLDLGVNIKMVNVGIGVGYSASNSNSQTKSSQISIGRSTTAKASSKLRMEHKTTIKEEIELTEEFGSRRVLHNPNPLHSMDFAFWKLYQKNHIILERTDARLCAKIFISDPGEKLRNELSNELKRFNPTVPQGSCPEPLSTRKEPLEYSINNWMISTGGDEWTHYNVRYQVPPNMTLIDAHIEVISMYLVDGDNEELDGEGLYEGEGFFRCGGDISFYEEPQWGATDGAVVNGTLYVQFPEEEGFGWHTLYVNVKITWKSSPTSEYEEKIRDCKEKKLQEIKASFSSEKISSILTEIHNWEKAIVDEQIFRQVLFPAEYSGDSNVNPIILARAREMIDWENVVIEYIPWYLSSWGRKNRQDLLDLLLSLPGETRSDWLIHDFLVASYAIIYLPLSRECESDALGFLTDWTMDFNSVINDFNSWYINTFELPEVTSQLPDWEQIVDRPGPIIGPPPPGEYMKCGWGTPELNNRWLNTWERPRRKFIVLDEWPETVPTDGVHIESVISECTGADILRTRSLTSDLATAEFKRELLRLKADIARLITDRGLMTGTIELGDQEE